VYEDEEEVVYESLLESVLVDEFMNDVNANITNKESSVGKLDEIMELCHTCFSNCCIRNGTVCMCNHVDTKDAAIHFHDEQLINDEVPKVSCLIKTVIECMVDLYVVVNIGISDRM
jgi:hypothetical protein